MARKISLATVSDTTFDESGAQRILDGMGKHFSQPSDFNLALFTLDLKKSKKIFVNLEGMFSVPLWKAIKQELARIKETAKRLAELLAPANGLHWKFLLEAAFNSDSTPEKLRFWPFLGVEIRQAIREDNASPYVSYEALIPAIERLATIAALAETGAWHGTKAKGGSAFTYFVGGILVPLFKKHFKQTPRLIRDPGMKSDPRGSFIDFAMGVVREFGITKPNGLPYKPETIAKALSKAKKEFKQPNI